MSKYNTFIKISDGCILSKMQTDSMLFQRVVKRKVKQDFALIFYLKSRKLVKKLGFCSAFNATACRVLRLWFNDDVVADITHAIDITSDALSGGSLSLAVGEA